MFFVVQIESRRELFLFVVPWIKPIFPSTVYKL